MIFLTVGTQLPFDRLVRSIDEWCAGQERCEVFGQIAEGNGERYTPRHFDWKAFLEPDEIEKRFQEADIIVGHAGMGTIISALTYQRPLVVMPRRAEFGEHRNDHQLATASRFGNRPGLNVATDETEVSALLDRLTKESPAIASQKLTPFADPDLISAVRTGILGEACS